MSTTPISILLLAANSRKSPLQLEHEVKEIKDSICLSKYRDNFCITSHSAVTPRDFRRALLSKPQIIHFSGHGFGENGILLEDESRNTQIVETEAICNLFEIFSDTTYCVILNACHSDVQASLISKYIPYVIGMNSKINDDSAIEFSVGFYDALGAGESIELAYRLGCNAIQMLGLPGSQIPSLHYNKNLLQKLDNSKSPSDNFSSPSNLERQHLQDELRDLNDRFIRLSDKISFFQRERDIRSSSDVQFQLSHQIAEITSDRDLIRRRIKEIEDRLK